MTLEPKTLADQSKVSTLPVIVQNTTKEPNLADANASSQSGEIDLRTQNLQNVAAAYEDQ